MFARSVLIWLVLLMLATTNAAVRERAGHHVVEAETGKGALERLRDSVDVVLVDYPLSDIDGLAVLREVNRYADPGGECGIEAGPDAIPIAT